jgi:purine-nucleoside phosphorylase
MSTGSFTEEAGPLDLYDRVQESAAAVRSALGVDQVDLLCILGSGLGKAVEALSDRSSCPAHEIPYLPPSTVDGHEGVLHAGKIGSARALVLQGRAHAYEGRPIWQLTLLVRVAAALGAKAAVITNSAGALNPDFGVGELMLIGDHLNLSARNPLVGPNDERLGPRFPDLTVAYDEDLRASAREGARKAGIPLHEGVYAWFLGPCYETPAEVRMARLLGADAVGMSTVPEVIVARHSGMRVLAFSCIANQAAGMTAEPLTHDEVHSVASATAGVLADLILEVLPDVV